MITLTVGISNSGKTTWAEQQDAVNLNRDDIRFELYCQDQGKTLSQYKYSKHKENKVTAIQFERAAVAITQGHDVIVSDTNLNQGTHDKWAQLAKDKGIPLEIKEFPCEPHVAKTRNQKREHSIPASAIDRQYAAWRQYKCIPNYNGTHNTPKAVIFDVDGTLADMTGVRHPFDWAKVGLDKPRKNVIKLAKMLSAQGVKIIVMSGRDGVCQHETAQWLHNYDIPFHVLFQRKAGDSRPDAIIKEELFWEHVADDYDVQFVVDDRNQMVDRWRAMGLECWQVQAGDF